MWIMNKYKPLSYVDHAMPNYIKLYFFAFSKYFMDQFKI